MSDTFKIWIDRLKAGGKQKIEEILDPSFLDIHEKELRFETPVEVHGEAYLSDDQLILRLHARTKALMPCAICNQMVSLKIEIKNFYHAQPIEEIPSAVFDFQEILREELLLQLPQYIECSGGKCPERATIAPYMRSKKETKENTYLPFKDLGD